MKKVNVTFSIPEDINKALHSKIPHRKLSAFVSRAINKALEEENNALKLAYAQAAKDLDRKEVIEDWNALDGQDWE